MKFKLFN